MMKSTGIVRKIDGLGRIVIPKELRNVFNIEVKDPMEIYVDEDRIILQKYEPACTFCDNMDQTIDFKGKEVCQKCIDELKGKSETDIA